MGSCVNVSWKSDDSITWNQIRVAIKFFYICNANEIILTIWYEWSEHENILLIHMNQ
jgi:hypothetical protein